MGIIIGTRIEAQRRRPGLWEARTTTASGGTLSGIGHGAVEAIEQLLRLAGHDPSRMRFTAIASTVDKWLVEVEQVSPSPACDRCHGTGIYRGLAVVETCEACGGSGVATASVGSVQI